MIHFLETAKMKGKACLAMIFNYKSFRIRCCQKSSKVDATHLFAKEIKVLVNMSAVGAAAPTHFQES